MFDQNHQYRQDELPPEVFNSSSGDIKNFNGYPVKVIVNNNGTRSLIPTTAAGGGSFNFDYDAATKAAYDSLGQYYQGLLGTYTGNMNKVLAHLQQDYETGVRTNTQDTSQKTDVLAQDTQNNANARGLDTRSNFDTSQYTPGTQQRPNVQGFGIPTQKFDTGKSVLDQGLQRYLDSANQTLTRGQQDQATALKNEQDTLEQNRRTEAAGIVSDKATQAYNEYASSPTLA